MVVLPMVVCAVRPDMSHGLVALREMLGSALTMICEAKAAADDRDSVDAVSDAVSQVVRPGLSPGPVAPRETPGSALTVTCEARAAADDRDSVDVRVGSGSRHILLVSRLTAAAADDKDSVDVRGSRSVSLASGLTAAVCFLEDLV